MNTTTLCKWVLAVVWLPLAGCAPQSASIAAAAPPSPTALAMIAASDTQATLPPITDDDLTNAPDQNLEDAPGEIVSTAVPLAITNITPATLEIIKLAQAGVDESVMLSFITNSSNAFHLTSDVIIYLNDIGVPSAVVTAMLQNDQAMGVNTAVATADQGAYTNQLVPAIGAPSPYAAAPGTETGEPPPPQVVESVPAPQVNVTYSYFYDSLSPYGTWIDIDGYGRCWQPTVVVANRNWQPYFDRGRWVYSDHGWYWASDYSWGWATFHYGRWFRHNRWGWCWAPDTVWAPAWVSWRYSSDYCGWAPLPPSACYTPGFGFSYWGRSVGFNFSFGLRATHYSFVRADRFCDRYPYRYRLPHHEVRQVFPHSRVATHFRERNGRLENHGIPVENIKRATRSEIRPVSLRETAAPRFARTERVDRDGQRVLPVFRPNLPLPTQRNTLVGQGVEPARRDAVTGRPRTAFSPVREDTDRGATRPQRGDFSGRMRERATEIPTRTENRAETDRPATQRPIGQRPIIQRPTVQPNRDATPNNNPPLDGNRGIERRPTVNRTPAPAATPAPEVTTRNQNDNSGRAVNRGNSWQPTRQAPVIGRPSPQNQTPPPSVQPQTQAPQRPPEPPAHSRSIQNPNAVMPAPAQRPSAPPGQIRNQQNHNQQVQRFEIQRPQQPQIRQQPAAPIQQRQQPSVAAPQFQQRNNNNNAWQQQRAASAAPQQQQRWTGPGNTTGFRSAPAAQPAPRIETRQAPPQPQYNRQQQSNGSESRSARSESSRGSGGSRENREDGRRNR